MPEATQHWRVIILREPKKVLSKLPKNVLHRIWVRIQDLEKDPRPDGCIKLQGYENLYRLRVGDWRIIYAVEDDRLIVLIIEVAPRGGAYRNL
jgi:mRNA interferase RelE/StbE